MRSVVHLFLFSVLLEGIHCHYVGTWNIQNFGPTKAKNEELLTKISQICGNFDVLAIQEISDTSGKAMETLMNKLPNYGMVMSQRVGQGGYAEQYAVIYNKMKFIVTSVGVYNGSSEFKRAPYFATVKSLKSDLFFGLGVIHTSPELAVTEVDRLADAADWYISTTNHENVMVVGDYNSACNYVRTKDYRNIRLYTRPDFRWLVPTCFDSTVSETTDCAYDRIVIKGERLWEKIVPFSSEVYDYKKIYRLNQKVAESISDHYPVRLEMQD